MSTFSVAAVASNEGIHCHVQNRNLLDAIRLAFRAEIILVWCRPRPHPQGRRRKLQPWQRQQVSFLQNSRFHLRCQLDRSLEPCILVITLWHLEFGLKWILNLPAGVHHFLLGWFIVSYGRLVCSLTKKIRTRSWCDDFYQFKNSQELCSSDNSISVVSHKEAVEALRISWRNTRRAFGAKQCSTTLFFATCTTLFSLSHWICVKRTVCRDKSKFTAKRAVMQCLERCQMYKQ